MAFVSGYPVRVGPKAHGRYVVQEPLRWEDASAGVVEEVPAEFVTDFATMPVITRRPLWIGFFGCAVGLALMHWYWPAAILALIGAAQLGIDRLFATRGVWDSACVLHDFMVDKHVRHRAGEDVVSRPVTECDAIWKAAMLWSGVPKWRVLAMTTAVGFGRRFR